LPDSLVQAPNPPETAIEAPPSRLDQRLIVALSTAVLMVTLSAFWGARMRAGARHWTIDAWQVALAALPGPYHARLVLKDLVTRLPRNDIEDAATLLARAFSAVGRGRELDVRRSLRETLRAGLRPALIYRSRRVQQTLLILQDSAQTMAVHEARVESLLADLRRQGVIFERWYFDGDVSMAASRRNGPPISLESLARRREDWPLMIISSGMGIAGTLTLQTRGWMSALRTWTRRVWLSPIQDPHLWPAALRRLPIKVVPMTRDGLLQAAAILARGESAGGERSLERPVTVADVRKLRRLASVVPNPTIPELQLLRQRFAPEVPERAVMHLATDLETHAGAPLRMSDGDIREYLRQLRREAPATELAVRRYLLTVLADSEPVSGSAAHLRWQAHKAIHEVRIAELTSSDTRPALAMLAAAARGPLWREVREAMERLAPAAEHTPEARKAVGLAGDRQRPPTFRDSTGLHLQPFYWRLPRWEHIAAAVAITLVVAAAASRLQAFRVQPGHDLDAYVLEYHDSAASGGGELRVTTREASAPARPVSLYRDAQPWVQQTFGADGSLTVAIPDEPHVYQARAQLPDGSWAFSNTVWAPSVLILIDAQPWARVTVRSATVPPLTETTPAAFRLPPGSYELSLENGNVTAPLTTRIDVASGGQRSFQFTMPNFDANQILEEFGVSGTAQTPATAQ
jgi:hypothetical protein